MHVTAHAQPYHVADWSFQLQASCPIFPALGTYLPRQCCLDGETSSGRLASEHSTSARRIEFVRNTRRPGNTELPSTSSARAASSIAQSSRISALAERNCLFNFSKRSGCSSSGGCKSKKKCLEMWSHGFVCLAKADRERVPTAMERATLTSSG